MDVDFIVKHKEDARPNEKKYHIWFSINGFQQLCMRQRSREAIAIRQYFIAVDRLYRDHAERILYERRQDDSDSDIENLCDTDDDISDGGEMAYLDKITQTDPETHETKVFFHPGHTSDEAARNQNRKMEYGKRQEIVRKKYMKGSPAVEEEFKRLASRWKVKCGGSPRKEEVFYSHDLPADAIWETSLEVQDFADMRLEQRLARARKKDRIIDKIPMSQQSTEDDSFTFGTKHGNLKTVRKGRTLRMVPKNFVGDF
jgi:hypothetical protein